MKSKIKYLVRIFSLGSFILLELVHFSVVHCQSLLFNDILTDGNNTEVWLPTESGIQHFIVNSGLLDGANKTKIFGENRPTTLWNDHQRTKCYEYSLRLIAQMPTVQWNDIRNQADQYLNQLNGLTGNVDKVVQALDLLNTNYVSASTVGGEISNQISSFLRTINPKSFDGVTLPTSNLSALSDFLSGVSIGSQIADYAVVAGFQEALSGDMALWRLNLIEQVIDIQEKNGIKIDPALRAAIGTTRNSLVRNKDYFGAFLTTLSDRRYDASTIGVSVLIQTVKGNLVQMMTNYYMSSVGMKAAAAATKATTVAALWTISLSVTYEVIVSLLEQHEDAQIAVTSATLSWMINKNRVNKSNEIIYKMMELQGAFDYFNQMVIVCSGIKTGYYDAVSGIIHGNRPYEEAREEFEKYRDNVKNQLIDAAHLSIFEMKEERLPSVPAVLLILDNSGSMADPMKNGGQTKFSAAQQSLLHILDLSNENQEWCLMIFNGCSPEVVQPFTTSKELIKEKVLSLAPLSSTPLASSLEDALDLIQREEIVKSCLVVLLTDGIETCRPPNQTVEAAARYQEGSRLFTKLIASNDNLSLFPSATAQSSIKPVYLNVVGFGVSLTEQTSLLAIAAASGGKYFGADNAKELDVALTQAFKPIIANEWTNVLLVFGMMLLVGTVVVISSVVKKRQRTNSYLRYH